MNYCVSAVFYSPPSPWLLLRIIQLLWPALPTVPPRKNRFAIFLVQIVQPRAPVLLLSRSAVPLLVSRLSSQGPVDLSSSFSGKRSQMSVAAVRRPTMGFAELSLRNAHTAVSISQTEMITNFDENIEIELDNEQDNLQQVVNSREIFLKSIPPHVSERDIVEAIQS
ncbi:MAG: hypothetical protein EZS28_046364, partial [Streblomastix strix]